MRERDLQNLRFLMTQVMRATGWRRRRLEEKLGIGHGNLEKLLDGTLDLRVRHVLALAEFFEVRPGALLDIGCPETTASAQREVDDLLAPGRGAMAAGMKAGLAERRTAAVDDLDERIAKILDRELERRGVGQAPKRAGGKDGD